MGEPAQAQTFGAPKNIDLQGLKEDAKTKYHVATTADGFIARKDGTFDCFPMEGEHVADYLKSFTFYARRDAER